MKRKILEEVIDFIEDKKYVFIVEIDRLVSCTGQPLFISCLEYKSFDYFKNYKLDDMEYLYIYAININSKSKIILAERNTADNEPEKHENVIDLSKKMEISIGSYIVDYMLLHHSFLLSNDQEYYIKGICFDSHLAELIREEDAYVMSFHK